MAKDVQKSPFDNPELYPQDGGSDNPSQDAPGTAAADPAPASSRRGPDYPDPFLKAMLEARDAFATPAGEPIPPQAPPLPAALPARTIALPTKPRVRRDTDPPVWVSRIDPADEILGKANPRSLYNLVPPKIQKFIDDVPEEWLGIPENQLLEELPLPHPDVGRVRLAFWKEYDAAQAQSRRMSLSNVAFFAQIPEVIVKRGFVRPADCAWILCPPISYSMWLDEAASRGFTRLREELLEIPLHDATGHVNVKHAELLLKTVAFLDMRKNGMPTQKHAHLHASASGDARAVQAAAGTLSAAEIDARIAALESRAKVVEKTVLELPQATLDQLPEVVQAPQVTVMADMLEPLKDPQDE